VTIAVEVPSNWDWDWTDAPYAASAVLPREPDVEIGVHVGPPERPPRDAMRYVSRGVRFEVGWSGGDFLFVVRGERGIERSARFDADFRHGEIRVAAEAAEAIAHPLAHPLDELILLHRLVREGCLVVEARLREGPAGVHVYFDAPCAPTGSAASGFTASPPVRPLVLRPRLTSRQGGDTGVWVYEAPWRRSTVALGPGGSRGRLAELHLLSGEDDGRLPSCRPRDLLPHEAGNELLRRVNAPIHDVDSVDRLTEIVSRIVRAVRVSRVDAPAMSQGRDIDWDSASSALGFALPML